MAKELRFGADAREPAAGRRRPARRGGQVHPRAQGPQRHPREDHRVAGGHQRRRDDRPRDPPEDQFENMGAQLVKEAAIKTNDIVGDGTTTATVIAQAIVREGMQAIDAGGNPVLVKRGIDLAVGRLVEHLQQRRPPGRRPRRTTRGWRRSRPTTTTRSARCIAKALHTVGDGGIVTVEESAVHGHERRLRRGVRVRQRLRVAVPGDQPGQPRSDRSTTRTSCCAARRSPRSSSSCRCWRRSCAARGRWSSSPRTSRARRCRCWCTTTSTGSSSAWRCGRPGFGDRRLRKLEDIADASPAARCISKALRLHPGDDDRSSSSAGPGRSGSPPSSTAIIGGAGSAGRDRVPARPAAGRAGAGARSASTRTC